MVFIMYITIVTLWLYLHQPIVTNFTHAPLQDVLPSMVLQAIMIVYMMLKYNAGEGRELHWYYHSVCLPNYIL